MGAGGSLDRIYQRGKLSRFLKILKMGDLFVGYSLIMIKWHKRVPFFLKECNEILQIH